ncbi:MAG: C69 family dipeptidase, partial [Muribaculaceae bacterium]|nr:C69 family dipeptidase [Muribaculaceae bacterium]
PYRWRPMTYNVDGQEYTHERAIATQQTGFSFVSQMRADRHPSMKGILWFGVDDANTCVYVPIFNCVKSAPYELAHGNGDMLTLSWDAMFWVNNYVANQAYNRYSQMIPDIRKVQGALENEITADVADAEKAIAGMGYDDANAHLQNISETWSKKVTKAYKTLGDRLFVKFMDGNIKPEDADGNFARTPEGMPASPKFGGYNQEYFDRIAHTTDDHFKVREVK